MKSPSGRNAGPTATRSCRRPGKFPRQMLASPLSDPLARTERSVDDPTLLIIRTSASISKLHGATFRVTFKGDRRINIKPALLYLRRAVLTIQHWPRRRNDRDALAARGL